MRASTAYFAGIGTVVAAIGAGLGGGLLLGNIMSPHEPKHGSSEMTRLEQRHSPPPISAMNISSQPVPYLASSQAPTNAESAPAQAERVTQPQPQPAQQPADTKPVADAGKTLPANTQAVAAVEPAAKERTAPDDSFAKARDADLRRETRRADDRRKAERRQQWSERRRIKQRDGDDLRDVEASVREATEPRPLFGGSGFGTRINLFED